MIITFGQTTGMKRTQDRKMALLYAITEVLTQAPDFKPFPGEIVDIPAERFTTLLAQILETANKPGWATFPGYHWEPVFEEEETIAALQLRGYRSTTYTAQVVTPSIYTAPPLPTPPALPPTPTLIVEPIPYTPPVRTPATQPL